ncbi:hypothetical protein, partial [Escherichia coli]|uniref:hypothetical protein n=1 Tax=Escherichia coli TaxID=562 RepID=UPI003DA0F599
MKITNYILPTSRTHGSFSTIKSWDTMNYLVLLHILRCRRKGRFIFFIGWWVF